MTPEELKEEKDTFIRRYNIERTRQRATQAGIVAASQHNSLYRYGLPPDAKVPVREYWENRLNEIAAKYASPVGVPEYEEDIQSLKRTMNALFADRFRSDRHPRFGYDPGFRISHAQKSLSVCLKHLWCMGEIETPPQCPVDSVILRAVGLSYPQTRWACINSIDEHRERIDALSRYADRAGLKLAEWELVTFLA
jgi:hypothetical protein